MSKPTIFFSHSSKDKDMVGLIKNKIDTITGGAIEIFVSSDGQSIPFGRNWVHKVEDGLNTAEIMFVFVTPNSIASNWIYFEAGFAYAKNIQVIPVGIGMDIALLKAPLNLLQGFNVVSGDSLNNFISVINDKFEDHFKEDFSEVDYINLNNQMSNICSELDICEYFRSADCCLIGSYFDKENGNIIYDMTPYIDKMIAYLTENHIPFSWENKSEGKYILIPGIKFLYHKEKRKDDSVLPVQPDKVHIIVSLYNFQKTLPVLEEIIKIFPNEYWIHLKFHLNNDYMCVSSQEDVSAIVSELPDDFEFDNKQIGIYKYLKGEYLTFSIEENTGFELEYVLRLSFLCQKTTATDIVECLGLLIKNNVIIQKENTDD